MDKKPWGFSFDNSTNKSLYGLTIHPYVHKPEHIAILSTISNLANSYA